MKQLLVMSVLTLSCADNSAFQTPTFTASSDQASGGLLTVFFTPGGAPVVRTITLNNADVCDLTFTATVEDAWLAVTPASGTVTSGLSTDLTVTVSSGDASGNLPVGDFVGTLDVAATCPKTGKAPLGSPLVVAIQAVVAVPDAGVADGGSASDAGTLDAGTLDAGH